MNLKSKLLIFLGVLAIFGVIALYINEFKWFQNYLHPQNMILGSLLVGVLVGVLLGFRFQKKGEELVDKIQIWTVCLVVTLLPMPLLASLTNRLFAEQKPYETQVQFWQESKHIISGGIRMPLILFQEGNKRDVVGYFIFLIIDGEMVRVESKTSRFSEINQGDTVTVPIKHGLFNVDFVEWQD